MNALVGFHAIEQRSRDLDLSFIRRAREASRHELILMRRAHLNLGCEDYYGECWKCACLARAEGKR